MFGRLIKRLIVVPGYIANYGYTDASGGYYIVVNTDKCDGCGKCVTSCPNAVLELIEDPYDPLDAGMVVAVVESHSKKIKYSCAPCKPVSGEPDLRCVEACPSDAISHSW